MLVLVSSTAGSGHFGPLVPFVHALADAGHQVRVTAPGSFRSAVESAGFAFEPLGEPSPDELGAVFGRLPELSMAAANRMVLTEVFAGADARAALPAMGQLVDRLRPDLIVREPAEFAGLVAAQARGIPSVSVNLGLDAFLDHTIAAADALAHLGLREPEHVLLSEPRWTVLPRSVDAAPQAPVATQPQRFAAPAEPAEPGSGPFLAWGDDNRPLVYLTFGSVAAGLGLYPLMYRAALDALADLPVRVLVTTGKGADLAELGALPDSVRVQQWVPQADVLRQARLVVHHGGYGTMLGALTAGVAQIAVPLFAADQFDNAVRIDELGLGLSVPGDLTQAANGPSMTFPSPGLAAELRRAAEAVLADQSFHERAACAAAEVAELTPVAACVAHAQDLTAADHRPASRHSSPNRCRCHDRLRPSALSSAEAEVTDHASGPGEALDGVPRLGSTTPPQNSLTDLACPIVHTP
jgi:UDP:flavonoid glycosyltransferase YjiC (YdhE family)